jgi:hypothetical protein
VTAIERTLEAPVSAAQVWQRCYVDASAWSRWNPEIAAAELHGPFEVGSIARVRFKTGLRLRFRLVEVESERLFTDEARIPGARMGHRHELEPTVAGVRLRNTIYFDGPLARMWTRLARKRVARALEEGQRRAAALAAGAP